MSDAYRCLVLDFGASSIRMTDVSLVDGRLALLEYSRLSHGAREQDGMLIWDYPTIYGQIERALAAAGASGRAIASVGAASWGGDYVLLDEKGARIGHPVSYRDDRTDGLRIPPLIEAILPLFVLDPYVPDPIVMMAAVSGDTLDETVQAAYRAAIEKQAPDAPATTHIERFAFYQRAKTAFAVVMTGETAKYGNIILKKDVTPV